MNAANGTLGGMSSEQKVETFTDPNGQLNLGKLRQFERKHGIAPLKKIDHSTLQYKQFVKNFYAEHPDVEAMTADQVNRIRKEMQIFVKGELVANPITKFSNLLSKCVDSKIIEKFK